MLSFTERYLPTKYKLTLNKMKLKLRWIRRLKPKSKIRLHSVRNNRFYKCTKRIKVKFKQD